MLLAGGVEPMRGDQLVPGEKRLGRDSGAANPELSSQSLLWTKIQMAESTRIGMRMDLRLEKEEKRKRGKEPQVKREERCGRVLSYYTKFAGVRVAVWYLGRGGGGRSARGDWRGLKRGGGRSRRGQVRLMLHATSCASSRD